MGKYRSWAWGDHCQDEYSYCSSVPFQDTITAGIWCYWDSPKWQSDCPTCSYGGFLKRLYEQYAPLHIRVRVCVRCTKYSYACRT